MGTAATAIPAPTVNISQSGKSNKKQLKPKSKIKNKAQRKRVKPIDMKQVDFKLHIAIDFGTDGCGLAFAHKGKVKVYNKWKGAQAKSNNIRSSSKSKTKTQLVLNKENKVACFGNAAKFMYCNLSQDGKKGQKFFERFKMALYDNSLSRPDIVNVDEDDEKKQADVDTAEYLYASNGKRVKSKTVFVAAFQELQKLAKEYIPKNVTKEKIDDDEIQWILTVPAIWSQRAKNKMKEWIIKAGLVKKYIIDQCVIVYEPDCASISMQKQYLRDLTKKSRKQIPSKSFDSNNNLIFNPCDDSDEDDEKNFKSAKENANFEKDDKYILIDAGGGTVDIACHKILENGCVEEIVYPTGDKWGSCYVDDLFIKLLEDIYSKEWINEYRSKHAAGFVEILENFQMAKATFFNNKSAKTHRMRLPEDFMGFLEEECGKKYTTPEDKIKQYTKSKRAQYFRKLFSDESGKKFTAEGDENLCSLLYMKEKITDDADGDNSDSDTDDDTDDDDDDGEYMEYLVMDVSIWKCLFDSKINNIIHHVKQLLEIEALKDCRFLGLVGGFSCSKYFQERMQQSFGTYSYYQMTIVIPKKPMLSVVEGAALMAITEFDYIRARKLKYTYGVLVLMTKQKAKDKGISEKYIRENPDSEGRGRVQGCFVTLAAQNERVAVNDAKDYTAYSTGSTAVIHIMYSKKLNPKTKNDGEELATLNVPTFESGKAVIVEFHFYGTIFEVYAYAKDKPEDKKTAQINYVK